MSALGTSPGVRELGRRYENAVHVSQSDVAFRARLDLILSEADPFIKTIENSPDDEEGAMLDVDLDESLERYAHERASLVEMVNVPPSVRTRDAPRLQDRTTDA